MSLGAVIKEQRNERVAQTGQEVEYEMGNGQNSDDEEESEGGQSKQRIVMMYDEHGNATQMRMGRFYYDSVPAANSEDEDDPQDNNHQERDTLRANVPAPFDAQGDFVESGSSNEEGNRNRLHEKDSEIEGTYVADGDDHDYEDEEDEEGAESADDPFRNQFMRIEIPAAQLKDVSRVKKDLDHDKPHKKKSLMVGLQRAVSSVKMSNGGRRASTASAPPQASQISGSRASAAKIGRLMSFSKDKKLSSEASTEDCRKPGAERASGPDRTREGPAGRSGTRQGLAAVGRMMSITKSKGPPKTAEKLSSAAEESPNDEKVLRDRRLSNASEGPIPGANAPGRRVGLAQVGRMLSINRKKPAPSSSTNASDKTRSGSGSSERENVRSEHSIDRDRQDLKAGKPAAGQVRMGLAKVGRMMSMSRMKKQTVQDTSEPGVKKNDTEDDAKHVHLSPVSSSTVSSKPVDSPASEGHDRQMRGDDRRRPSTASNPKKDATRKTLRNAGRLLSFSRKPATTSSTSSSAIVPTPADSESDAPRGRSLLVPEEGSASSKEKSKRAQSVPPSKSSDREEGDRQAGAGSSKEKLDGRASKFYFTEINSDRVLMSGLLGSDTHIRVPGIAMAEYSGPVSRTKWYIDAFTLPHNAVRRECIDLYEIFSAMARFKGDADITRDDINDFEDWWKTASSFFHCYFDMERTILFPWVDAAGTQDFEVQMALKKMRNMKDKLQEHLIKIDNTWNEKMFKGPGEMYALLYRAADEFVPRLMNYFADQEVLLPAIVRGYYKLDDRLRLDKDIVNAFMGGPLTRKTKDEAHHNLVLLIRWMGNQRQLRAWIGKNLSSTARGLYTDWYAMSQEKHLRLVRILRNRGKAMLLS